MPHINLSDTVGADGSLSLDVMSQVRGGQPVLFTQVSIELVGTTAVPVPGSAVAVLRLNGVAVTPLVAQLDAAGGDPPVPCLPGDQLTVEWSGAAAGNVGRVLALYTDGTS